MTREQHKTSRGRNLKYRNAPAGVRPFAFLHCRDELLIRDQLASAWSTDPEALIETDKVRRRVGMHALSRGLKNRTQEGDRRAFAICAGNMNDRWQFFFGMIKRRKETLQAIKRQVDALGVQRCQTRDDGVN
jgi:hypothetical protein